jgi:hypothetical protein
MITDATDPLSSWYHRMEWDTAHPGNPLGFTVGVYDAESEMGHCGETVRTVSAHCAATPENLIEIAKFALAATPPKALWKGNRPQWITMTPDLSQVLSITEPGWTL